MIQLADGSIANVEVQKIGYAFPGQRSACYSADLLLRQYKRVKGEKGKLFSYKDIKKVYTIVLFEKSTSEFHQFQEIYLHLIKPQSDTGIQIELLQEYVFISLDIFRKKLDNIVYQFSHALQKERKQLRACSQSFFFLFEAYGVLPKREVAAMQRIRAEWLN